MHSSLIFRPWARIVPLLTLAVAGVQAGAHAQQTTIDAVNASPGNIVQRAATLVREGRRNVAEDLLSRYLATNQSDGRAWLFLGTIHFADAQRWHRDGHTGSPTGPELLEFAASSFEAAQQLLTDSGNVYRVLVAVERATIRVEEGGWQNVEHWNVSAEELPLPPVLAELGRNLLASCPRNGVLVTGSMVEEAAAWGTRLLAGERPDLILLRANMYQWDLRYRGRMAAILGADSTADLPSALVHASATRAICLSPTLDSLTTPAVSWRPVRLVLAAGPAQPASGQMTVFQFGRTGLTGSVWTAAAREVYDLAARRNQALCTTLFANSESQGLPAISSCPR